MKTFSFTIKPLCIYELYPPKQSFDVVFTKPQSNKLRLFILNGFPDYDYIWTKDISIYRDYSKLYNKIFHDLHGKLPKPGWVSRWVTIVWTSSIRWTNSR